MLFNWAMEGLKNQSNDEISKNLTKLTLENVQILGNLTEKYNLQFESRKNGTLYLYETQEVLELAKSVFESKKSIGLQFQCLSKEECVKMESTLNQMKFYGGILSSLDWSGDTYLLCKELERVLKEMKVPFHCNSNVKKINKNIIQLENGETMESDEIILCTGTSLSLIQNNSISIPKEIIPIKGYSLTYFVSPSDSHLIPTRPIFNTKESVVLTPFQSRIRISGVAEFSGFDSTISEDQIEKLKRFTKEIFPKIDQLKILNTSSWSGFRALSSNGNPITQRISEHLILNLGHAHLGSSLAFSCGKRIVELI
jgi:D-amino-acid dehydrogenase